MEIKTMFVYFSLICVLIASTDAISHDPVTRGAWVQDASFSSSAMPSLIVMSVRFALVRSDDYNHVRTLSTLDDAVARIYDDSSDSDNNHFLDNEALINMIGMTETAERVIANVREQLINIVNNSNNENDNDEVYDDVYYNSAQWYKKSTHHDYLTITVPVAHMEKLFNVKIGRFVHSVRGTRILRAVSSSSVLSSFSLSSCACPLSVVSPSIQFIDFLHDFPMQARRLSKIGVGGDFPGIDINPAILQNYYSLSKEVSDTKPNATQSAAEFEAAFYYPADLAAFQRAWSLPLNPVTLIGPNDPDTGYLGECSLDLEYIGVSSPGIPTTMWSIEEDKGFDLIGWADAVAAAGSAAPDVHSISWGTDEREFDPAKLDRVNGEFAKLAALGLSVLAASGDDGTGHDGDFWCTKFSPTFPATSPYVTAVGGSYLTSATAPETCWDGGGGGFSNHWSTPDWQLSAVANYLSPSNTVLPTFPASSFYNSSGRAIPDVSLVATNYALLIQNTTGALTGTSASTPVVAGMVSKANEERAKLGKRRLGFLNKLLYSLDTIGNDVVQGSNKGDFCPKGFPATKGWDACSGLGSPVFPTLLEKLVNAA